MAIPRILRNSGLYSFVSFLQKGAAYFLLPVYTAYLTPEDYGTLSVIQALVSFFSIFLLLSLDGAAARFHFFSVDQYFRARIWGTILLLVLGNSVVLGLILIIFNHWLVEPFAKGIPFYPLIFLALLATILSPLYLFFQRWLQVTQQGGKYVINMLLNFVILTTLNIVALVVFKLGVLGWMYATLITSLLFFLYSLIVFVPHVRFKPDKSIIVDAYKYSLPLLPHTVSSWFMSMVDRVFINNFLGTAKTGLYSVGYQFGNVVGIIASSVNQAFSPWFMERVQRDRQKLAEVYIFAECAVTGYCFLAFVISFFSPEVIRIMTSETYHLAWKPVVFLSFGQVFSGLYYFLSMPLWLKRTKYVFLITLISALTSVTLNYLFIPIWGIIGAAIALCISLFVCSVWGLYLSLKAEPDIVFFWRKMYIEIFLFLLLSVSIFGIEAFFESVSVKFFIKLLIALSVLTGLIICNKQRLILVYKIIQKKY